MSAPIGRARKAILRVLPLLLLIATALAPAPMPAAGAGPLAAAKGASFLGPDGRPLFVAGVNYVGHNDRAWTMWEDGRFDVTLVEVDFARARNAGANVVRVFVRAPLQNEIAAGRWSKLDAVVALAKQQGLLLLITFYDYAEQDLAKVATTIRATASRYASEAVVFGYDLKNEPHFSDLVGARYPDGVPPLRKDTLVRAYGERATQAQVAAWRLTTEGRAVVPAWLPDVEAYYAANGYRIYQEFVAAIGQWVTARAYTVAALDFLASPDAARWRTLLEVLDGTLAAWLRPQLAALRAVDTAHLVTVGYNDPVLAQLPANGPLSFVSLHRFPSAGKKPMQVALDTVRRLQQITPGKPVLIEEFGYSNAARSPSATALDEGAFLLGSWAANLAGGMKWMLNDVAQGWNATEQNFGLYRNDGTPKPVVAVQRALSRHFARSGSRGALTTAESGGVLTYTYSALDALIVGSGQFQDARLSFGSPDLIQVSLTWSDPDVLLIAASGNATLTLNPRALLADSAIRPQYSLAVETGQAVPFNVQGDNISFTASAGEQYLLKLERTSLQPKVEIVWPHDNKPVQQAQQVNVGAYLFQPDGITACASGGGSMRLWRSLNNGVEEQVAVGHARVANALGLAFNIYDFNNVDVSAARDPANKYFFRLSVDGSAGQSNIWSHGADSRTNFPFVDVPAGIVAASPAALDAKIEVVWPHGNLPVDKADKVNVAAYVFQQGTKQSVAADWTGAVRLWRSLNNGVLEQVAIGTKVVKSAGAISFPVWEFNNVDVGAARDPLNKYYFRLSVDGVPTRSNVWSHGKDGRTYFPQTDVPAKAGGC